MKRAALGLPFWFTIAGYFSRNLWGIILILFLWWMTPAIDHHSLIDLAFHQHSTIGQNIIDYRRESIFRRKQQCYPKRADFSLSNSKELQIS